MSEKMSLQEAIAVVYFMDEPHWREMIAKGRLSAGERLAYEHAQYVLRKAAQGVIERADAICLSGERSWKWER